MAPHSGFVPLSHSSEQIRPAVVDCSQDGIDCFLICSSTGHQVDRELRKRRDGVVHVRTPLFNLLSQFLCWNSVDQLSTFKVIASRWPRNSVSSCRCRLCCQAGRDKACTIRTAKGLRLPPEPLCVWTIGVAPSWGKKLCLFRDQKISH